MQCCAALGVATTPRWSAGTTSKQANTQTDCRKANRVVDAARHRTRCLGSAGKAWNCGRSVAQANPRGSSPAAQHRRGLVGLAAAGSGRASFTFLSQPPRASFPPSSSLAIHPSHSHTHSFLPILPSKASCHSECHPSASHTRCPLRQAFSTRLHLPAPVVLRDDFDPLTSSLPRSRLLQHHIHCWTREPYHQRQTPYFA